MVKNIVLKIKSFIMWIRNFSIKMKNIIGLNIISFISIKIKNIGNLKDFFQKMFILFIVGFLSRIAVNYMFDINVFRDYNHIISLIYYGFMAFYIAVFYFIPGISFKYIIEIIFKYISLFKDSILNFISNNVSYFNNYLYDKFKNKIEYFLSNIIDKESRGVYCSSNKRWGKDVPVTIMERGSSRDGRDSSRVGRDSVRDSSRVGRYSVRDSSRVGRDPSRDHSIIGRDPSRVDPYRIDSSRGRRESSIVERNYSRGESSRVGVDSGRENYLIGGESSRIEDSFRIRSSSPGRNMGLSASVDRDDYISRNINHNFHTNKSLTHKKGVSDFKSVWDRSSAKGKGVSQTVVQSSSLSVSQRGYTNESQSVNKNFTQSGYISQSGGENLTKNTKNIAYKELGGGLCLNSNSSNDLGYGKYRDDNSKKIFSIENKNIEIKKNYGVNDSQNINDSFNGVDDSNLNYDNINRNKANKKGLSNIVYKSKCRIAWVLWANKNFDSYKDFKEYLGSNISLRKELVNKYENEIHKIKVNKNTFKYLLNILRGKKR